MVSTYTLKVPNDLRELFEKYIEKFPNLGYKKISKFIIHLLEKEATKIVKTHPELDYYKDVGRGMHVKRSFMEVYKEEGLKNTTTTNVKIRLDGLKEEQKKKPS